MGRTINKEEKIDICKEIIFEYLTKDNVYSFVEFANCKSKTGFNTMNNWLIFAKENLSSSDYNRFYHKVFILEPKEDGSDIKEKEELKVKLLKMAEEITFNRATFFDVIDTITPSLSDYMSMLHELRYHYKELGMGYYSNNLKYYKAIKNYNIDNSYSISFPNLSEEDVDKILMFIAKYNLPVNNITLKEAYKSCKLRGIIDKNNTNNINM